MIYKCFVDEWKRIKKFYTFSNFDLDHILDLSRNLENWLILKSVFIHWKTASKHDLQVLSWWMEEVLVIFKFWPTSHTRTLAEILKLTNFEFCLQSLQSCESQSKVSNLNVKMIHNCFLDEWKRIKKFQSLSNFDPDRIP